MSDTAWLIVLLVLLPVMFSAGTLLGGWLAVDGMARRDADDDEKYVELVGRHREQTAVQWSAVAEDRGQKLDQLGWMLTACEAELARVEAELEVERRRRLRAEMQAAH